MGNHVAYQPDYTGIAELQAKQGADNLNTQIHANRPNQTTPFGTTNWSQDPNGNWNQSTQFNGPLAGVSDSLQQQAGQNMSTPFSFGQFGQMDNGSAARDQAINAAYGQSVSRLDPQWRQREDSMRSNLANQGLDMNSEAARGATANLGAERNDAYSSAMNNAIGQGTAAQQATFGQNMAARQQAISEALRQRGMPMEDLQRMQGLLGQPGFNAAGQASGANYLGALQSSQDFNQMQQKQMADMIGGGVQAGASLFALSDERAKQNIVRHNVNAMPGVPFASWEYKANPGVRVTGVIAQDLEKVAPQFVHFDNNGMRLVDYSFLTRGQ